MSSSTVIEENPEYHLVVSANNMSVEVENEILLVHKFIRDHYAPRFPELEQLISDPWTYIAAVRAIANVDDITRADLPSSLPAATILSINLSATGSQGRKLSDAEWLTVERAADVAEELKVARETIFSYVESRMAAVAPNLSAIVGTNIAAKLLGLAGGLHALSRQPSCNIMLFGAMKKSLANSHLSVASQQRHTGFIYQSSIVQSAQPEDRRRAQRAVSAKVTLAARTDAAKGSRTGDYGRKVLVELQKKIEKMAEPPPNKISKALPIPQETNRKKRGGKRARAQKEAYATTELRKLQNRMEFGKAEEETGMDDETVGLGMIGSASGRVRGDQVDARSKGELHPLSWLKWFPELLGLRLRHQFHMASRQFSYTSFGLIHDVVQLTIQPSYHEPTRSAHSSSASPCRPTPHQARPPRCRSPPCRASKSSRHPCLRHNGSRRPTSGGLQGGRLRMSKRAEAVYRVRVGREGISMAVERRVPSPPCGQFWLWRAWGKCLHVSSSADHAP
jgi:U4/U6 small nuclear ribonucleoprotein PRP31